MADKDVKYFANLLKGVAQTNKERTTILKAIQKEIKEGNKMTAEQFFGIGHFDPKKGYQKNVEEDLKLREEENEMRKKDLEQKAKLNKKATKQRKEQEKDQAEIERFIENKESDFLKKYGTDRGYERMADYMETEFATEFANKKKLEELLKKYGEERGQAEYKKYLQSQEGYFKNAMKQFSSLFGFIFEKTGLQSIVQTIWGTIKQMGNLINTIVLGPIKGIFNLTKGIVSMALKPFGLIGSAIFGKSEESALKTPSIFEEGIAAPGGASGFQSAIEAAAQLEEADAEQEKQTELLEGINEKLEPKAQKIKGGMLDKLSSLFGAGKLGVGSMLAKSLGVGLIIGGLAFMIKDFVEGYMADGLSGGLTKALLGDAEGGISSTMKNAGKFAMVGAGIGMFFGPLGGIIGGLAGAAIGGLLNSVWQLIKGPGTNGEKVATGIFGGISGPMSTMFSGMKWASMGFLLGLPFGGPIGGLIGAGIGFLIGSITNIVWQMIGEDGRKSVTQFFDKASEWMGKVWDSIGGFFSGIGETIGKVIKETPILNTIGNFITDFIINPIKNLFSRMGSFIKDKVLGWWNGGKEKDIEKPITKVKPKKTSFLGGIFGGGTAATGDITEKDRVFEKENIKKVKLVVENILLKIYDFMRNDMIAEFDNIMLKNLDKLFMNMQALNMENRLWQEFKTGVTPSGAISKFDEFNKQMTVMTKKDKTALGNNLLNQIDNRTNIINNINDNRQQKLKRR